MEGKVELINNLESKTVSKLQRELAEAYKTIAGLREKIALLERRHPQSEDADDREPKMKPSPILERKKAEEIIPKECWELVFQNLDAEDLFSCRQVCRTFNRLLEAKQFKEKWKFRLILPLLCPYLKTTNPVLDQWEHLSNARLTCRSWCHWIDQYVTEMQWTSFFPLFYESSDMPLVTRFRTIEVIDEFQQRFDKCSTNPFPSRSVYIEHQSIDQEPVDFEDEVNYYNVQQSANYAFCWKVGDLLEQFGKHIFTLKFRFQIEHMDPLTLCKLIKRVTIHLPNLKELLMVVEPNFEEEDQEVVSYIAENALAALPKLRALNIEGLDKKMLEYLLDAYGPQLTQLKTTYSKNLGQFQMQQLKNLRKLWLVLDKPRDTLKILRSLESPLKLLNLTYRHGSAPQTVKMDKLLRNLKHLPIELLDIRLWFWSRGRVKLATDIDVEAYKNATIKTLIIHTRQANANVADGHISFNFLQALTKLENLELKFSGRKRQLRTTHPGEQPEVVKLNEYLFGEQGTDLPYHSNVWEKVASLKTFTLIREVGRNVCVNSVFTREQYERIRLVAEGEDEGQN